jgi:N-acetylmuramoyl-L-alanine amidase
MSTYKWLLDAGHGGMTPSGVYTTAPSKMHIFSDGLTFYEGVNNRAIVDRLIPMMEKAGIEYETVYDAVLDTPLRERVEKANAIHAKEKCGGGADARIFATDDTDEHRWLTPDGQAPTPLRVVAGQAGEKWMATDDTLATLGKLRSIGQQSLFNLHYPCPSVSSVAQKKSPGGCPGGCIYLSIHSDAMPDGAHGKGSGFSIYTSKGQTASDVIGQIFCGVYADNLKQFRFRQDRSDGDADMEEDFYVLRKTHCPALLVENLFFDNRREAEFLLSEVGRRQIADALFTSIQYTEKYKPV